MNSLAVGLFTFSKDFLGCFPRGFCMPGGSEALHTIEAVGGEAAEGLWFLLSGSGSREVQQLNH